MKRRLVALVGLAIVVAVVIGVVVARRGGGGHTPARLPISASNGSADGGLRDAALAPYGVIVYHAGPDLPSLDSSTRAYRVAGGDPRATASRLADALGLHGEPTDAGGGALVLTDGAAQLTVTHRDWSFNRNPSGAVASGVAVACPPDAPKCVPDDAPPAPTRPADLPSQDDARATAVALLQRAGVAETKGAAITVDDGITQWFVSIQPVVAGLATEGMVASVIVGEEGTIESAAGVLGTPSAADEYPLIGTKEAIDRLNRGEGYIGPRPLEAQDAIAADDVPTVSAGSGSAGSAEPAEPSAMPIPGEPPSSGSEPPVTDTLPPPAPQDVTLTSAELVLLYVTSNDGTEGWLVPAYRFGTSEGSGPTVIAVDDRFLAPADAVNSKGVPAIASDGGR